MTLSRTFKVDRTSKVPLAQQIFAYYAETIRSGAILFGTKLPSIRDLSEQLDVNKISVISAYERLADESLATSRPGSGFFVSFRPRKGPSQSAQTVLVPSAGLTSSSAGGAPESGLHRHLPTLGLLQPPPNMTPLGASHAPADLIPFDDLRSAARHVLHDALSINLSYEHPQGLEDLRNRIAADLDLRGIPVANREQVLITGGALQALNLALDTLTTRGDSVAVEAPSFAMVFPCLRKRGLKIVELPRTFEGLQLSPEKETELRLLAPKVLIVAPDFQNPTGGLLSVQQRHALLRLAHDIDTTIIEMDVFHGLHFGDTVMAPLAALDGLQRTIYISSFSKILVPGLRVGFVTAAPAIIAQMTEAKTLYEISTSSLDQKIVCEFMAKGTLRRHLQKLRDTFRSRRDTMNAMLRKLSPQGSKWTLPEGGIFLWFEFPNGAEPAEIETVAAERRVSLAPGRLFYPDNRADMHMRLNFAILEPVSTYRAFETIFALWRTTSARRWQTANAPIQDKLP